MKNKSIEGDAMVVDDISHLVEPFLLDSVKNKLNAESVKQTVSDYHRVKLLGIRGPTNESAKCAEELARAINKACNTFQIVGKLANPIKIDVHHMFWKKQEVPESFYMMYIAFTPEAADIIGTLIYKKDNFFFKDGDYPSREFMLD